MHLSELELNRGLLELSFIPGLLWLDAISYLLHEKDNGLDPSFKSFIKYNHFWPQEKEDGKLKYRNLTLYSISFPCLNKCFPLAGFDTWLTGLTLLTSTDLK